MAFSGLAMKSGDLSNLLLNSNKTEIMVVGPKSLRRKLSTNMPSIDGISNTSSAVIMVLLRIQILHLMHILKTSQWLLFITKFGKCCPCIMLKN